MKPICPRCLSKRTIKRGTDRFQRQRYKCNVCAKEFTELTGAPRDERGGFQDLICPHCHRQTLVKNGLHKDRRRYVCRSCGKRTIVPLALPEDINAQQAIHRWLYKRPPACRN